jgi:hypothetical protein
MRRVQLYLKVEIERDAEETPERIGEEICRQLMKVYGVESAELSSFSVAE